MCRSKTRSKWGTAAGTIKERKPSPASTTRWIAILIKKKEAVRFRRNMGSRSDQIPEMASVFDRPRGPVNGLESCCSVVYLLCRVAQFLLLLLPVKKPLTSRMRNIFYSYFQKQGTDVFSTSCFIAISRVSFARLRAICE
jgi:hypothetical protein